MLITAGLLTAFSVKAETVNDTLETETLRPALVTGTRNLTDARHLPMTVSLVSRKELTKNYRSSVLPTVCEQVPGLFITSRGMLGYGVSTGAAGGIKVRGIGGGAEMLVLIDGQPQYAGLMGHPIADAYQTMMAEKVEVLRGPSSVLYGSNAMGGVMNIVTRKIRFAHNLSGRRRILWHCTGTGFKPDKSRQVFEHGRHKLRKNRRTSPQQQL